MEAGLELDLAETHRLLAICNSGTVRDHLHGLLTSLLQRKQALLAGASSSQAAAQHVPLPHSGPPAALQASGSNAALDTSGLANGFGRNVSLGSTGSGGHAQGGGVGAATDSSQLRRTRSLTDTAGDTQSTNSGGAIEPILSSAMVLADPHSSQQLPDKPQHMALGAFDPVWQPSKVGASSEPVQALDGLLTAQHLWQQVEQAGLGGVDGFGAYLGGSGVPKQHGGGGNGATPLHGRPNGMGVPGRPPPPPQHTQHMQHSPLGPTAAAAQWVQQQQQQQQQQQHSQQHQHQHQHQHQPPGFPTVTAPYSRGMLAGSHQMTSYGSPKTMLHNLPGNFGATSGNLPQGYHTGRAVVRGGPGGFGSGGVYGNGPAVSASFAAGAGGSGGLYGGNFPSPYAAGPFSAPVHPSLQYGVDLRGGELDAMGMPLFRPLTTYSWEQSDGLVKIYVPLRGVQTELLRATFTLKSLEVRVVALQGKNYVYAVKSLFMPINVDGCHVAASKTKKNVLITLQKLRSETPEEKHWHDLTAG